MISRMQVYLKWTISFSIGIEVFADQAEHFVTGFIDSGEF